MLLATYGRTKAMPARRYRFTARCGEVEVAALNDVESKLARRLIELGHDPQELIQFSHDDAPPSWRPAPLALWAGLTVRDSATRTAFAPYEPGPFQDEDEGEDGAR